MENNNLLEKRISNSKLLATTLFTTSIGVCGAALMGNVYASNVNLHSESISSGVSVSSTVKAKNSSSESSNSVVLRSSKTNSSATNSLASNNSSNVKQVVSSSQSLQGHSLNSIKENENTSIEEKSKSTMNKISSRSPLSKVSTQEKKTTSKSNTFSKSLDTNLYATQTFNPMASQNSTARYWQQQEASSYNNGLAYQINQEAQQNAAAFQKQLSNAKAMDVFNKLNAMGKKLAQAANLNLSNLSESEIEALNKVRIDGETYDGQLTYAQYKQYGKTLIDENKQFAIPKFDKNKIMNFPAATTKDAQTGQVETLDIWDSWPVVQADNGKPVDYNGYELVIGMMGNGSNWDDGHLYLLYNRYGDNNFDDWKCAGPIFGFNESGKHEQWSGSATVNSDGSIQLYYTEDDATDGNHHQQIATATLHLTANNDGVSINDVTNRKILFAGDGYYYQTYQQWKNAKDSLDDFCLRDPHVYEQNGQRYLVFEAGTGMYNYQGNSQIYDLRNYGEKTVAEDIQDLFSIINNKDMTHRASLANGCIGLMELGGTEEDPAIAKLFAPVVSAPMVSDEIERPVTIKIGDKYYLFTDTRLNRGIDDPLNNEANAKIGDNVGMLGFVADSLDGNYKPLNGSGVVLTATVPSNARTSEYSWYAVPMLDTQGNPTNYVLITAYMSNRNQAAGKGLNATWAPSFVVKINPDDTTEVLDDSVTAQQGIWVAPTVTTGSHMAIQARENDNAVQVNENGKWYLRENGKNLTGFQYIKNQNKTVYYDPLTGQMLYGQQKINGYWYDFDSITGAMKFGYQWISNQNKEVYYNPVTGSMVYGQQKINDKWQYFDPNTGAQAKNQYVWISNQDKEVYYDGLGNMVYGQQKINGKWQYFDLNTGAQVKSQYVWISNQNKEVYYDGLGNMVYGQQKINGKWQYFDPITGAQAKGQYIWIADQNKEVYYDNSGNMVYGQQKINGKWQYFDPNTGAQAKNQYVWISNQDKEVYYDGLGNMVYGQQKINGKWQYFNPNTGAQAKNQYIWIADQHKKVYYDGLGNMIYGWQTINGKKQYFNPITGALK